MSESDSEFFLLKIWAERPEISGQPSIYRGRIERGSDSRSRNVRNLSQVLEFVEESIAGGSFPPGRFQDEQDAEEADGNSQRFLGPPRPRPWLRGPSRARSRWAGGVIGCVTNDADLPPDDLWISDVNAFNPPKGLNVYLADVRENRKLRTSERIDRPQANGDVRRDPGTSLAAAVNSGTSVSTVRLSTMNNAVFGGSSRVRLSIDGSDPVELVLGAPRRAAGTHGTFTEAVQR